MSSLKPTELLLARAFTFNQNSMLAKRACLWAVPAPASHPMTQFHGCGLEQERESDFPKGNR